eukprot:482407-Prymnesium_polylepis.1
MRPTGSARRTQRGAQQPAARRLALAGRGHLPVVEMEMARSRRCSAAGPALRRRPAVPSVLLP